MPDIYAHSVFALQMLDVIPTNIKQMLDVIPTNIKQMLKNNITSYKWGAMGPDPFYYYGQIVPKKNAKKIRSIGTLLHTTKIDDVFSDLLTTYQVCQCDVLKSYIVGYLSHYFLDKTCHPFIFYRSGFSYNTEKAFVYSKKHKQYEMGLDAHILSELHNKSFSSYHLYKDIELDSCLEEVYVYMSNMINDSFDINILKSQVRSAFKENYDSIRLFSNHRNILLAISHILPYRIRLTLNSVLPIYTIEHDYLNLAHSVYQDPCTGIPSYFNFLELMEIAQDRLKVFIECIETHSVKDLVEMLKSESYETGHPYNMKMKYHNSIL